VVAAITATMLFAAQICFTGPLQRGSPEFGISGVRGGSLRFTARGTCGQPPLLTVNDVMTTG
jgi:hypothetical protein